MSLACKGQPLIASQSTSTRLHSHSTLVLLHHIKLLDSMYCLSHDSIGRGSTGM